MSPLALVRLRLPVFSLVAPRKLTGHSGIHPALRGIGLECRHVGVRLLAYVGGLAVLAAIAADLVARAPAGIALAPIEKSRWLVAVRPYPAFSVPMDDFDVKSISYDILRHAQGGGRRDVLTWREPDTEAPVGRLQIYRPGTEIDTFGAPDATLADSAGLSRSEAVYPAGVIATKFGKVELYGFAAPGRLASACIGFLTATATPKLEISGWFCPGEPDKALRTLAACAIDRLTLLSSGNDAGIAALFAQAELRRGLCSSAGTARPRAGADWITSLNGPNLRGAIALR